MARTNANCTDCMCTTVRVFTISSLGMADGGKTRADGDTYKLPPIDIHKDGSPRAVQNRSRPGSKLQSLVGEDNKSPVLQVEEY